MHKRFIQIASLFGALAIILGAFGAHALKHRLTPDALNVFEVGVRYQFYHVVALFLLAILYKDYTNRLLRIAGNLFIAGIFLFSGSLYLLTYFQVKNIVPTFKFGLITPLGGVCFIIGWILLAVAVNRKK